ncbi:MAG: hypothetical protein K2L94_01795 [Alphaproteobacteria bacterium]|nr:hypothetical protein [Alphaproteobacteria bacterium]
MKKSLMLVWGVAMIMCGGAHGVATLTCPYDMQCDGHPENCLVWGLNNCCTTCSGGGGGTIRPPLQEICLDGQYPSSGVCVDCPDGGTTSGGAASITDCYQPSGTSFSDTAGSGTYTRDCYYSR